MDTFTLQILVLVVMLISIGSITLNTLALLGFVFMTLRMSDRMNQIADKIETFILTRGKFG